MPFRIAEVEGSIPFESTNLPHRRIVLYDAAFFMPKKLWQTVPGSEP